MLRCAVWMFPCVAHLAGSSSRTAASRLLGILRTEGLDICLERQPGLGSLGALVDETTAAGTPVCVDYVGRERSLPPGVDLCAYRVAQEALTNARKHAPGMTTSLTVSYLPDAIELEVINELPNGRDEGAGGGHGLLACGNVSATTGAPAARASTPVATRERPVAGIGHRRMIRVLLADDQALVHGGFRAMLEAQPDIEVWARLATVPRLSPWRSSARPDLALLDVRMPRMDGIELPDRVLEATDGGCRVLIVTTFDPDDYVYTALKEGASGFLLKTVAPNQLVSAVRDVGSGRRAARAGDHQEAN